MPPSDQGRGGGRSGPPGGQPRTLLYSEKQRGARPEPEPTGPAEASPDPRGVVDLRNAPTGPVPRAAHGPVGSSSGALAETLLAFDSAGRHDPISGDTDPAPGLLASSDGEAGLADAPPSAAPGSDPPARAAELAFGSTPAAVPADLGERARLFLGRTLGGYRIESVIGAGGMAIVFRATQLKLRRQVALKLLAPELLGGSEERIRRFQVEAQAAAQVAHPNVAQVYDVGEWQGTHYIAMELVEGQSLARELQHAGAVPVERTLQIGRAVATGLRAAAEAGVHHRDVKPGNIIIPDARVGAEPVALAKLVDFGIAQANALAPGQTTPGAVVGTPLYMAPERFLGTPVPQLHARPGSAAPVGSDEDHRADIYSLGVTMLEMLTAKPIGLGSRGLPQVRAQVEEACPRLDADARAGLAGLLWRMMAEDPARRPEGYAELLDEIDAVQALLTPGGDAGRNLVRAIEDAPISFGTRVGLGLLLALGLTTVTMVLARLLYRLNPGRYDKPLGLLGGSLLLAALGTIGVVMSARLGWLKVRAVDRWLRVHMLLGTLAPAVILLHGGARPGAILPVLNVAALVVIVASGLTGRFVFIELERRVRAVRRRKEALPMSLMLAHQALRRWRMVHHPLTLILVAISILHVCSIYYYGGG